MGEALFGVRKTMRTRLSIQIGIALLGVFACPLATGQSNQWWIGVKSKCGLSSGLAYNDWVASGSPCNSGTAAPAAPAAPATLDPALANAVQSVGYSLGQQLGKALFGDPAAKAANAAAAQQRDLAAQQSALAAQQLNNSGIYLYKQKNYTGAINEFQKALAITPNDATILQNLASAKQQIKDTAVAAKNSGALGQFLGDTSASAGNSNSDRLSHSSVANPNASALNSVNLDSDANVVNLRGATSASPESLKSQLDGLLTNHAPASAPPDPLLVLPEARDIELLFEPPQSAPSPLSGPQQRPANDPKLVNPMDAEQQTANSLAELNKVLDSAAEQDLQRQFDWFNNVYLPAHPELQNAPPAPALAHN
jgi:tetratricopeptide (TPR) repeat protein